MRHRHTFFLLFFIMSSFSAAPAVLARQASPPPQAPAPQPLPPSELTNAHETRDRLNALLDQHPPSLREVVRLDPMLLRNSDYLAMYPALASFLQQHPEVGHNPEFFLGAPRLFRSDGPPLALFIAMPFIVLTITTGVVLLARTAVEHRRWQNASKAQTELNNKLIDRFSASTELLGYLESSHGKALTAALSSGGTARGIDAPLGRILGSLQAGSVLACAGLGILFVSVDLPADWSQVTPGIFAIGIVVLTIGVGLLVSSAVSFVLSRRLGLMPRLSSPQGETPGS